MVSERETNLCATDEQFISRDFRSGRQGLAGKPALHTFERSGVFRNGRSSVLGDYEVSSGSQMGVTVNSACGALVKTSHASLDV